MAVYTAPESLPWGETKAVKLHLGSVLRFVVCPLLSGLALVLAFPKRDLGMFAWIALVPLLLALWGRGGWHGASAGFLCGLVFFPGIFGWIFEISGYTWLHHMLLALYLGSTFAAFGAAFSFVSARAHPVVAVFFAPAFWVVMEYMRSTVSFLALPWGLLAHSQYLNPRIIQCASIVGTYGVSFLIVLGNAISASLILLLWNRTAGDAGPMPRLPVRAVVYGAFLPGVTVLASAVLYGTMVTMKPASGPDIKISVIQANIEQPKKWNPQYRDSIMETYADLSRKTAREKPVLITWPETATPDSITANPRLRTQVERIAEETGAFLVLGSSRHQKLKRNGAARLDSLNSAFVVSPAGESAGLQRYDKIRLLPFGEYLPLRGIVPWSLIGVRDIGGYRPGREATVFEIPSCRFGVTICWENIFPELVRRFVKNGAQFIVNITNEAWFGKSAAPHQFLSMSVFRAVENRVYVVRCANTGISCFIDPFGRIVARVRGEGGEEVFVRGSLTASVVPVDSRTIYTHWGDWFACSCGVFSAGVLLFSFLGPRRNRRVSPPMGCRCVERIECGRRS